MTTTTAPSDSDWCQNNTGKLPSIADIQEGLGPWAIVLYSVSAVTTAVLGLQFALLVRQFILCVEPARLNNTVWVTSVFFVLSVFNLVSIVLPLASEFVWLAYKIYLAIAMCNFVDLTMTWYGGETVMLSHVNSGEDEEKINFRSPPCCCCFCLPKAATLSKAWIRFLKGSVYQVPYTESLCLFILGSLQISGYVDLGSLSFSSPYIYITVLLTLSNMSGLWGLFMFFNITHQFKLLHNYNYRKKSLCMKVIIVCMNVQGFVVDILVNRSLVGCIAPHISEAGVGMIIKAICTVVESILLGTVSFIIYKDEGTYL